MRDAGYSLQFLGKNEFGNKLFIHRYTNASFEELGESKNHLAQPGVPLKKGDMS